MACLKLECIFLLLFLATFAVCVMKLLYHSGSKVLETNQQVVCTLEGDNNNVRHLQIDKSIMVASGIRN